MENDALDLTPGGALSFENLDTQTPVDPRRPVQLAQNGSSPLYPGTPNAPGLFGSNRVEIAPRPAADPLDDKLAMDSKRLQLLHKALADPITNFIHDDKQLQEWRDEAGQKATAIQGILEKKQQQQDVQMAARNRGLTRTLGPNATQETLNEESLREMKEGNYNAYKGLVGAGQGARAELYMPEFVNSLGKQTEAGKKVVEELNKAPDQKTYNDIRNQILKNSKDGKHEYSASSLGLDDASIPKYKTEWEKARGAATGKLNDASRIVEQFKQQQHSLSQAVPITDEKAAAAVTGNLVMSNGETFPNIKAVTLPGAGGAQGGIAQPGSKDIAHLGAGGKDGWENGSPGQVETLTKQLDAEQVKGAISRYKIAKDFAVFANNDKVYTYSAGLAALNDKFGGVERNIAEASKGSGNIGLTKQLENQYGMPEHLANAVAKFRSELGSWVSGGQKGPAPKMSPQSIEGMKFIANVGLEQTKGEFDRLARPAETAGRYGIPLDKLGLDTELQKELKGVHGAALEKARLDFDRYPAIIKGDRRILLSQDAQVEGMIPAGSYAKTLPNGAQRASDDTGPPTGSPAAPVANGTPSPSGGGGTSPNGISKDYLVKTARIESGNEPDPWKSGNNKTSASGAFQFVKGTWDAFKPSGAPDRAADATPQQQTEAANNLTNSNAKVLAARGVPVNDTTAYIAHNLGAGGAVKFMKADDDADARKVVGEEAARNNPTFFRGNPTVGEAKARYEKAMNPPSAKQAEENYYRAASQVPQKLSNIAPAIGSTLGAIGGTAVGGPVGGAAGALAGGAAGGAIRQAVNGGAGYVDQTVRGTLEGIPAAVPGLGPARMAARAVAGGAVPAAEKLYDSGGEDVAGAIESGAAGATGGALGEAFGRGLGMVGHKIYSHLAPSSQAEVMSAAKILATQEPKVADATGKMVPNKAYEKAEQFVKDRGLDTEHAAYAYNVTKQGVPKGEALAQRPATVEAAKVGKEYDAIKNDVADAAATMSKNITPRNVQGGPTSLTRDANNPNGTVPAKYLKDAEDAQLRVTSPAKTWDAKWNQLGETRSDLLKKERDALASTAGDKTERANAMRALADSVRVQQEKVALHTLGPVKGKAAIARLEVADQRYRNAMVASGDGDIVKAIAQGGADGRKAQVAFDALAANDPAAQRMVRSLVAMEKGVGARAGIAGALLPVTYVLSHVPVVGAAAATVTGTISAVKAMQVLRDYMAKRGAGAPVKFSDMLARENKAGHAARAGSAIGSSIGGQVMQ